MLLVFVLISLAHPFRTFYLLCSSNCSFFSLAYSFCGFVIVVLSLNDVILCLEDLCLDTYLFNAGIRVQSLKDGQITMDIDFRWGGDPSIILGVEALVASIPIQVGPSTFWSIRLLKYIFIMSEPLYLHVSYLKFIVPFATVERSSGFHCYTCHLSTCRWDTLHLCCRCCSAFWGTFFKMCNSLGT